MAARKGVKRRLKHVAQKVGKKGATKNRMTPAMKLRARRAAMNYKKRRTGGDKVFDRIRTKFRQRVKKGYKKPGRPLRAGTPHPLSKKARSLSRKAKTISALARKKGRGLTKAEKRRIKALGTNVKSIYSGNRKRLRVGAGDRAREIVGKAIIDANKLIAAAKKTGNKKTIAMANRKAHVMLVRAKNQGVQLLQDARRDLTSLRKMAGRNKGRKFRSVKGASKAAPKMKRMKGTKAGVATYPANWNPVHNVQRNKSGGKRRKMKGTRAGVGTYKKSGVSLVKRAGLSLVPKDSGLSLVPKGGSSFGTGTTFSLSPKD